VTLPKWFRNQQEMCLGLYVSIFGMRRDFKYCIFIKIAAAVQDESRVTTSHGGSAISTCSASADSAAPDN